MRHMGSEFKQFILRGNVVDLAVAVVVGTAFAAVVMALVKDLITPIIAVIFGKPNFADLYFTINHSKFSYGEFVNALITFVTVAVAIFFFVVEPINAIMRRRRTQRGRGIGHAGLHGMPQRHTEARPPLCVLHGRADPHRATGHGLTRFARASTPVPPAFS